MGLNPDEIEPVEQLADKLDEWARRIEPKLPDYIGHVSFYGSLLKAVGNLPSLVFTWLQSRMPEQLELIRKDFDGLYEKAKEVGWQRSESPGAGANILKCQAQVAAKKLAQKLRLIVKMAKENLSPEKPAETERDTTPSIRQRIKKITVWIFKGFIAITLLLICLYVFGVVTGIFIFASVLTCLHLLGYLEQFNTLIDKILQLK